MTPRERKIKILEERIEAGGRSAHQAARELEKMQDEDLKRIEDMGDEEW